MMVGRQSLIPNPSPKREGSSLPWKWRELFEGYLGVAVLLLIKRKMVYGISCDDLLFLLRKTTKIVLRNTCFNAVDVALSKRNPP